MDWRGSNVSAAAHDAHEAEKSNVRTASKATQHTTHPSRTWVSRLKVRLQGGTVAVMSLSVYDKGNSLCKSWTILVLQRPYSHWVSTIVIASQQVDNSYR